MTWLILRDGYVQTLTDPHFQTERAGVKSADGERGMVWGVHVLAPYILVSCAWAPARLEVELPLIYSPPAQDMTVFGEEPRLASRLIALNVTSSLFADTQAKELLPMLQRSPPTLPLPPRIIYTSSSSAYLKYLRPKPLDDYQLLSYGLDFTYPVYKASKYCGDIVMVQLDRQFAKSASAGEQEVRVFCADPGNVATSIADGVLTGWWIWGAVMKWFYGLSFTLVSAKTPGHIAEQGKLMHALIPGPDTGLKRSPLRRNSKRPDPPLRGDDSR